MAGYNLGNVKQRFDALKNYYEDPGHCRVCESIIEVYPDDKPSKVCHRQVCNQCRSIEWDSELAYFVGLIVSDGCLDKNRNAIRFTNADDELIDYFSEIAESITGMKNKVYESERAKQYKVHCDYLYDWLQTIGIEPNKSLTISEVKVPDDMFLHFLRGVIDGDGSIDSKRDRINIYSGSRDFLEYLCKSLKGLINLNTNVTNDSNCFKLHIGKRGTEKLIREMEFEGRYYLKRKWNPVI